MGQCRFSLRKLVNGDGRCCSLKYVCLNINTNNMEPLIQVQLKCELYSDFSFISALLGNFRRLLESEQKMSPSLLFCHHLIRIRHILMHFVELSS